VRPEDVVSEFGDEVLIEVNRLLLEDKTNGFCPRNLLRRSGNITDYISSDIDLHDKLVTNNDLSLSTMNDETKTKELLVEKLMNKKSWFQPPQSLLSSKRIFIHK
jgi:hypothetical protein